MKKSYQIILLLGLVAVISLVIYEFIRLPPISAGSEGSDIVFTDVEREKLMVLD